MVLPIAEVLTMDNHLMFPSMRAWLLYPRTTPWEVIVVAESSMGYAGTSF
jgi:hypothetical protein